MLRIYVNNRDTSLSLLFISVQKLDTYLSFKRTGWVCTCLEARHTGIGTEVRRLGTGQK